MQRLLFTSRPHSATFAASLIAVGALAAATGERLFADPAPPPTVARDAALSFRFTGSIPLGKVAWGGVRLEPAGGSGTPTPSGTFVAGRPLVDAAAGRSVVVRPEAIREYFALVSNLAAADAALQAERTLARLEKTGDLRPLAKIDLAVLEAFGPGAGTRLDHPDTFAMYPAQVDAASPLAGLRTLVAGDDVLWRSYLGGDVSAFAALAQNPGHERLHHTVDPSTGQPSADSDLRRREHRRVIVRRTRNYVTFLPQIPMRADLADAGFAAGTDFAATAARTLRSSAKGVVFPGGSTLRFIRGVVPFRTGPDSGDGGTFAGDTVNTVTGPIHEALRIVNVTPPNGESYIDATTDWEDPDDRFIVPIPQRRYFVFRVRFSKPLDPRTVTPANFYVTKVATVDAFGNATPLVLPQPVAAGAFLSQRRMGEVVVEVQPYVNLDPAARYELRVRDSVRALDGRLLGVSFVSGCETD